MNPLPTNVKAGYRDYSIVDWPVLEANSVGRYAQVEHGSRIIRIATHHGWRESAESLLHELLHVAYVVGNVKDEDQEERTVTALSGLLAQMMRDSPYVFSWIRDGLVNG